MMINNKYQIILAMTFKGLLFGVILLSCTPSKKLKVLGFAYRSEEIVIKKSEEIVMSIKPEGSEDENKICSFNEELNLPFRKQDLVFNVIIDSSGKRLLDTVVNISKNSKEPFISIQYPSVKNSFKRTLFVADATDSNYIKY